MAYLFTCAQTHHWQRRERPERPVCPACGGPAVAALPLAEVITPEPENAATGREIEPALPEAIPDPTARECAPGATTLPHPAPVARSQRLGAAAKLVLVTGALAAALAVAVLVFLAADWQRARQDARQADEEWAQANEAARRTAAQLAQADADKARMEDEWLKAEEELAKLDAHAAQGGSEPTFSERIARLKEDIRTLEAALQKQTTALDLLRKKKEDLDAETLGTAAGNQALLAEIHAKELRLQEDKAVVGYARQLSLAQQAFWGEKLTQGLTLLKSCPEPLRDWEWSYLQRLAFTKRDFVIKVRPGPLGPLAFNPDGSRYALAAKGGGLIWILEVKTGKVIRTFEEHTGPVLALAFHPKGGLLACLGKSGGAAAVTVWDTASGEERHTLTGANLAGGGLQFSPDGHFLAQNPPAGPPRVWQLPAGKLITDFQNLLGPAVQGKKLEYLTFAPAGKAALTIAAGVAARDVTRWPLEGDRTPEKLGCVSGPVRQVAWAAAGKRVLVLQKQSLLILELAAKGGAPRQVSHLIGDRVLAVHPHGRRVAYAHGPQHIHVLDAGSGQFLCTVFSPLKETRQLTFSPSGHVLCALGDGDRLVQWDAQPVPPDVNPDDPALDLKVMP